jgi:hypothetical protein
MPDAIDPGMRPFDRPRIHLIIISLSFIGAACRQPVPQAVATTGPAPSAAAASPDVEATAAASLVGVGAGAGRWKDTAVYVDGRPVGMLAFGELPIELAPVWIEDEVSVPVKPGRRGPGFRRAKQRQYRFSDYLRAVGVDPAEVKELHIYGPKPSEVLVVTGAELGRRGDQLRFRFGGEVSGKAIPVVPDGIGNGRSPDKISAVMVYVARTPPTLVRNVGIVLDGAPVAGVPYAGEPLRGGVHVYLDDRLATVLKRKVLADDASIPAAGGAPSRWPLLELLEAQGVDTRGVVEMWIIRSERRQERLTRAQLADATFELRASARAVIHLGDVEIPAGALALHSRALRAAQLPRILPDEDECADLAIP